MKADAKKIASLNAAELESAWWIWAELVNLSCTRYHKHPAALTTDEYSAVFMDSLRQIVERPGMAAVLTFPREREK